MHGDGHHRLDRHEIGVVGRPVLGRPKRRVFAMIVHPDINTDVRADIGRVATAILERTAAGTGLQLFVARHGEVLVDRALGFTLGAEPMTSDHLHNGFCVGKPLLGVAAALLIEQGCVDLGTRVADVIGAQPWVPDGVTVGQVLSHDAGLLRPFGFEWRLCPPGTRAEFLESISNEIGPAYSEVGAGLIIEGLIEATTNEAATAFIERTILRPLGLADDIVIDAALAQSPAVRARVRVPIGGLPERRIPLLSERVGHQLAEIRPAFGCLVTMSGVGRLASALERVANGHDVAGLASPATTTRLLAARRGRHRDRSMRRECDFAAMTQVGLDAHRISDSASTRAFGHVAGIANCIMLADPATGIALAAYLNGSTLGDPLRAEATRLELVDGVIGAIIGDDEP